MKNLLLNFLRDDRAATAIEYGLIAGGIALVIVTAVRLVGSNLKPTFAAIASGVLAP